MLAKVTGLFLVIMSMAVAFNMSKYDKMIKDYIKDPMMFYPYAVLSTIIGLVMIVLHSNWVAGWQVVVTLVAWAVFIKGLVGVVAPQVIVSIIKGFKDRVYYNLAILISLLIGVYLTYVGFWS